MIQHMLVSDYYSAFKIYICEIKTAESAKFTNETTSKLRSLFDSPMGGPNCEVLL